MSITGAMVKLIVLRGSMMFELEKQNLPAFLLLEFIPISWLEYPVKTGGSRVRVSSRPHFL